MGQRSVKVLNLLFKQHLVADVTDLSAVMRFIPVFCVPEMFCGCGWPAGSDSASRCSREGWSGSVLDAAAENRLQDAPSEEPLRPHTTGSVQTGENIQVNLLLVEISVKRNNIDSQDTACDCNTQYLENIQYVCVSRWPVSLGIRMLINTKLHSFFFSRHQQLTKLLRLHMNEPIHHKPKESIGKYYSDATKTMEMITVALTHYKCVCVSWVYLLVHLCHVSFLHSFILLDSVISISEWSCHPADSSHVGRLWGSYLQLALPLAGQKHLHTISPHDHLPKVRQTFWNLLLWINQSTLVFVRTLC